MLDRFLRIFQGAPAPTDERRKLVRMPHRAVVMVRITVGELKGAMLDLSPSGFRLEYMDALKPNEGLSVFLPDTRPIQSRVVWCRSNTKSKSHNMGCLFEDSKENMANSWLKDTMQKVFESAPLKERRQHTRIRAGTRATLANKSGDTPLADGAMLDLSMGGCLLALPVECKPGTRIRTQITPIGHLKPLEMQSVVKWSRHGRDKYLQGVTFDNPLDPLVKQYFAMLLKQHGKTVG